MVDPRRVRNLRTNEIGPPQRNVDGGPLVLWMNRDKRAHNNWSVLYARQCSHNITAVVSLHEEFFGPSNRHKNFLMKGLEELEADLRALNIPLVVTTNHPGSALPKLCGEFNAAMIVTDFEPLQRTTNAISQIVSTTSIEFHAVDAHNIVPIWTTSNKLEFAAYTIRPKIWRLLPEFLTDYPAVEPCASPKSPLPTINWQQLRSELGVVDDATEHYHPSGGRAGEKTFDEFLSRLGSYAQRNDPNAVGQSNLSPYLHFGQISAQHVALQTLARVKKNVSDFTDIRNIADGFLEELIVRRELSDNYTCYNSQYHSTEGFPDWAKTTLNEHRTDEREYCYTHQQWEEAKTHDELWNAAQNELIVTGKMHGYMRMYWAKKILEWSASPEAAFDIALTLNDTYSLDGTDPNGYVGVAWSIGGVHDRAWTERSVYGKIRYMNSNGCRRKFDVPAYIRTYES